MLLQNKLQQLQQLKMHLKSLYLPVQIQILAMIITTKRKLKIQNILSSISLEHVFISQNDKAHKYPTLKIKDIKSIIKA